MQFISNRTVNIGITIGGQRMVVMFDERNENGSCSFVTKNQAVIDAIRRHSFFKKGIIWEGEPKSAQEPGTKANALGTVAGTEGKASGTVAGTVAAEGVETPAAKGGSTDAVKGGSADSDKSGAEGDNGGGAEGMHKFENFTEAKEWFCKKFNVQKTTVKTPTALISAAKTEGVTIVIG